MFMRFIAGLLRLLRAGTSPARSPRAIASTAVRAPQERTRRCQARPPQEAAFERL